MLRQKARDGLPNLWQPAAYLPVAELPLLGTGKLDLKGIKALAEDLTAAGDTAEASG